LGLCLFWDKRLVVSVFFVPISFNKKNGEAKMIDGRRLWIAICLYFLIAGSAQAQTCTSFSGNGINNWYPFSYRTAAGELTGIVVDGTREALKRMGLELEVVNDKPWKRIMYDLEQGTVDMVLGAYWNSERAEKFHYSKQLGTDELRVFVRKEKTFKLTSFEDLIGRSGMRILGGSLGDEFDSFAKAHLDFMEVPQSDTMVLMLKSNRADYAILGHVEGLQFVHKLGLDGEIVPLDLSILSNAMHVLINKNAPCAHRVEDLNKVIIQMQKDGTMDRITLKHIQGVSE
jgi:ABC-type amino acid transport substrate-binding protein